MKFARTLALTLVLFGSAVAVLAVPADAQEETNPTTFPDTAYDATPRPKPAVVTNKPKAKVSSAVYHQRPLKRIAQRQTTIDGNDKAKQRVRK